MRLNPNATNPQKKRNPGSELYDPRQSTPFAAAFTLGSLKALSIGGCSSVTLYQGAGPLGIVSEKGETYPVYNALLTWNQVSPNLFNSHTSHPLVVDSLYSKYENYDTLVLINYTKENQTAYLGESAFELKPEEIKTIQL
jgi:hypothetical protein